MSQTRYDPFDNRTFGIGFEAWKEYNDAIYKWLSHIPKWREGRAEGEIGVVYATPERAFARQVSPPVEGRIDIPKFSFSLNSVSPDRDRQAVPSIPEAYWYKRRVGEEWQRHLKAMPFDLAYTINFWHKKVFEANYVDWELLSRFRPISYVMANGTNNPVHLESVVDASDLEPGVNADRVLRRTYSIRVEGWLPLPYTQVPSVESINTTFTDIDPGSNLDEVIGDPEGVFDDPNTQYLHDVIWQSEEGATVETAMAIQDFPLFGSPKVKTHEHHKNHESNISLGGAMKL